MSTRLLLLPAARLGYAGGTAVGLASALVLSGSLELIGTYTYSVAIASSLAIVATFGFDKVLARLHAVGTLSLEYPRPLLRLRVTTLASIFAAALLVGIIVHQATLAAAIGFWLVARVFLVDVEAYYIASESSSSRLASGIALNGVISAIGTALGSYWGAAAMISASSLGNCLELLVLYLATKPALGPSVGLHDYRREAGGVLASATMGLAYVRVDLLALALVGTSPAEIGIYGLVSRFLDAAVLVRGSLSQQLVPRIARAEREARETLLDGELNRILIASIGASLLLLATLVITRNIVTGLLSLAALPSAILAVAALPLIFSHYVTSALVFALRQPRKLVIGSILTLVISATVKLASALAAGVPGLMVGIALTEAASYVIFRTLYGGPDRRCTARFTRAVLPLALAAVVVYALAGALIYVTR